MAIPEYPQFKPLGLEDKPAIDQAFARTEPAISELTFTNLFMWRLCYDISISNLRGFLLFLARPPGKQPFFYPPWGPGAASDAVRECLKFFEDRGISGSMGRVPQDYAEKHINLRPDFEVTEDPANDDYVYSSKDLISLEGRKYDGKRNAIRKFQRWGKYEYRPIRDDLIKLCLKLQDYWCTERQCVLYPGLTEENRAIRECFTYYEALGVSGGAIMVDGRVEAFSLGKKLNGDTFVVHIEKANPRVPGLYAV